VKSKYEGRSPTFWGSAISSLRSSRATSSPPSRGYWPFLLLPVAAPHPPEFRRLSSTRANRHTRQLPRTRCEALLGTRLAIGPSEPRDSSIGPTWRLAAAGLPPLALRRCAGNGGKTAALPTQSGECAPSDPRAALLPSVLQRDCRVRIRRFSRFADDTLHFSTYLGTFNFALSTFLPWRFPCDFAQRQSPPACW